MILGADTTFLVQMTVADLPEHGAALRLRDRLLRNGHKLALAPQVLAEFVHIVTDPRRFHRPLSMREALRRSLFWWNLEEVRRIYPDEASISLFGEWMNRHQLGRKRILDTLLAATLLSSGIQTVITSDIEGFSVFGEFEILDPISLEQAIGGEPAPARKRSVPPARGKRRGVAGRGAGTISLGTGSTDG